MTTTYTDGYFLNSENQLVFYSAADLQNLADQGIPLPTGMASVDQKTAVTIASKVTDINEIKKIKINKLIEIFKKSINKTTTFTNSFGVTSTYSFGTTLTVTGVNAESFLKSCLNNDSSKWKNGYWLDDAGVAQRMTFRDLQNLYSAAQKNTVLDETLLYSLIAAVQAATTADAVDNIDLPASTSSSSK